MTKKAKPSKLPWSDAHEHCAANHSVFDADGVPVLTINPVSLKPHGEDRVRDANLRFVLASVNNLNRLLYLLSSFVRAVPPDAKGLPSDLHGTAKETIKTIEKEIGST